MIEIAGLSMFLPPVPPKEQILYHNLPKKEQYWRREGIPQFYKDGIKEEEAKQKEQRKLVDSGILEKVTYYDPLLENYRREQWRKRKEGVWFYNNGEPVYLTGAHWFYLEVGKFDHVENDGYPMFYESQLERAYFREYCKEDPLSLGYFILGARGFGKTTEETSWIMESMTKGPRRRRAVIQSKSEQDAKDVIFKGKFVPMFKALPKYFQPENNHGTNPEAKLSFYKTAVKGAKAAETEFNEEEELESTIWFVNAKEKALDGQTLSEIYNDEIGKTHPKQEADVDKRMAVNRFCVFRNDRKVGLIRATTTVEEMEEGGKECELVYNKSNQLQRLTSGMTTSGMYRLFVGCLKTTTRFADKYGRIDEKKALEYHLAERKDRAHDIKSLSSWIRKNPLYEKECFIKDASKSLFNVFILTNRLSEIDLMKNPPYIKGNFYWKDGIPDTEVCFERDDIAGRWRVAKLLDIDQRYENQTKLANNVGFETLFGGKKIWHPRNNRLFRIGTDPIKYSKTKDPRASKAGMHVWEEYNPNIDHGKPMSEWISNNFIVEYVNRPEDPTTYFEDVILTIRYYSCSVLPESNIKELIKHLEDRGYGEFVIHKRNFDANEAFIASTRTDDGGLSSTSEVINSYVQRLISFVNKHGHRLKFPITIQQIMDFDPAAPTIYDAAVSAGYTLLAAEATIEEEEDTQDVSDWFDEYDQSGEKSRYIEHEESENMFEGL